MVITEKMKEKITAVQIVLSRCRPEMEALDLESKVIDVRKSLGFGENVCKGIYGNILWPGSTASKYFNALASKMLLVSDSCHWEENWDICQEAYGLLTGERELDEEEMFYVSDDGVKVEKPTYPEILNQIGYLCKEIKFHDEEHVVKQSIAFIKDTLRKLNNELENPAINHKVECEDLLAEIDNGLNELRGVKCETLNAGLLNAAYDLFKEKIAKEILE